MAKAVRDDWKSKTTDSTHSHCMEKDGHIEAGIEKERTGLAVPSCWRNTGQAAHEHSNQTG